jgi:hypothetical protein
MLAIAGVLIVTFGQWLNGGQYAVAPLLWLLIGRVSRQWVRRTAHRFADAVADDVTLAPGYAVLQPRAGV